MATGNAAATLARANDWATDFAAGQLIVKEGATTLATHTLSGFTTANVGNDATATADNVPNVATIAADGTADTAIITAGGLEYNLVVGVDVIFTTTTYVTGEDSTLNSLVVTFPE